jgi:hypothetical protein
LKKKIYLIYKLSFKEYFFLLFNDKNSITYFFKCNKLISFFIKKNKKFIKVFRASNEVKDENDMEVWTRTNYIELFEIEKIYLEEISKYNFANTLYKNFKIKLNIQGLHYYDYNGLWRNIYLINFFYYILDKFSGDYEFIYLCDNFKNISIFKTYCKKFDLKIISFNSINKLNDYKNFFILIYKLISLNFFKNSHLGDSYSNKKITLSMIFNGKNNTINYSIYNDFLFKKTLKVINFNSQYIINNKNFLFNRLIIKNKDISLFFTIPLFRKLKIFLRNLNFKYFYEIFKILFKKYDLDYLHFFLAEFYYKELFKYSNTRIFFDWNRHNPDTSAIYSALNSINSLYLIYPRSFFNASTPLIKTNADICFSFSKLIDIEYDSGSEYKYYIIVGSYFSYKSDEIINRAKNLRNQFFCNTVKHVFCYFDENTIDKKEFFDGHHVLQEDISEIMSFLEKEKNIGLVLKPKKISNFFDRLGNLNCKLKKLINQKRIYVYEDPNILVSEAALVSDFVIHCSAHASTAAIESVLSGKRTVLLNKNNYTKISKIKMKKNINYINSISEFTSLFKDHITSKNKSKFGLWDNEMLDLIDPYRDGLCHLRIGEFINDLSSQLNKNYSKERAIDYAVNSFSLKWGKDKVIRF